MLMHCIFKAFLSNEKNFENYSQFCSQSYANLFLTVQNHPNRHPVV